MKNWKRSLFYSLALLGLITGLITIALAWGATGHHIINLKAPMHLPASMAAWKADSLFFAAHASDADNRKISGDTAMFAESPRHFIDIDWYPNFHSLPHHMDSVIMQFGWNAVKQQGVNPWATVMELDSLTNQLRRNDLAKAESTMADIGHYVGDAHQPLHCTDNYDGQKTGNSGIHSRYETTMINAYQNSIVIHPDSIQYVASPLDFIFDYIDHSNTYVDSIMAADTYAKSVSGWNGSGSIPQAYTAALWLKTGQFTIDQFQRATVALASLWYTAWLNSQTSDTIVASVMGQGIVTPSGSVTVQPGGNIRFTFSPQTGYHVDSVQVDGVRVDSLSGYTFRIVDRNHTIAAWFAINFYTITATASGPGSISPAGAVEVQYGDSLSCRITPDSGYYIERVMVDGAEAGTDTNYVFHAVSQNHVISAKFGNGSVSMTCEIADNWNLLSIPCGVADNRLSVLFPTAASVAFSFQGVYSPELALLNGAGYWVKFKGAQTVTLTGIKLELDTIDVSEGWNLIGSLGSTIPAREIISVPPGIVTSNFFGYDGGYKTSDSLRAGYGYWVKVQQAGQLILSSPGSSPAAGRIRIAPAGELPPGPPAKDGSGIGLPREFRLLQAFPNPFNPTTIISFEIPKESHVTVKVYDLAGREIQILMNEQKAPGRYALRFDGSLLPSGVYICRIVTDEFAQSQKIMLLR